MGLNVFNIFVLLSTWKKKGTWRSDEGNMGTLFSY